MGSGHNARERRLLSDLGFKNRLGNELRKVASDMSRWRKRLGKTRNRRLLAKYDATLRRVADRLEMLEIEILYRAEDLKPHMEEELSVSKGEVEQFEAQYRKEVEESEAAKRALAQVRAAVEDAQSDLAKSAGAKDSERTAKALSNLRRRRARAERRARDEARDVEQVEKELESESRDKVLLTRELTRTVAEISTLRR